jgi:hypothetical protein
LGQDIIDYLFDWEKKYLEERNKRTIWKYEVE